MKTFNNLIFILCVFSLCSKAAQHIYRHFNPTEVTKQWRDHHAPFDD
jgi:hypothetical protein